VIGRERYPAIGARCHDAALRAGFSSFGPFRRLWAESENPRFAVPTCLNGSMRYGPNLLEEILRRTDIVQLVGRKVKLTRRGQAFWGCCPFHKEKSASFKVENGRRTFKCFGCGKGDGRGSAVFEYT
jgi:hypothetical protein